MELERLQRAWDDLGRDDPLWGILTWPGKRGNRWGADEFFATGESDVQQVMSHVDSLGRDFARRRALDFGCGVGRMTQPLARYFDEVCGVDIAPSMIDWAERFNGYGERCTYRVNKSNDLGCFPHGTFDFVLSHLTLQHMPPECAKAYVREFLRVLSPEGLLVFQMAGEPTARRPRPVALVRRCVRGAIPEGLIRLCRKLRYGHLIDMHGIPREEMVAFLEGNGGLILDVQQDTSAGGGWTSFRYWVVREASSPGAGER